VPLADLVVVARADMLGRGGRAADASAVDWFEAQAAGLGLDRSAPRPLVRGRDVLELGIRPGPDVGRLLRLAWEAQLDGQFGDHAGGVARCWAGEAPPPRRQP
jgi:tRNA nucleotidyltransferase (CCA-adding enzyme)